MLGSASSSCSTLPTSTPVVLKHPARPHDRDCPPCPIPSARALATASSEFHRDAFCRVRGARCRSWTVTRDSVPDQVDSRRRRQQVFSRRCSGRLGRASPTIACYHTRRLVATTGFRDYWAIRLRYSSASPPSAPDCWLICGSCWSCWPTTGASVERHERHKRGCGDNFSSPSSFTHQLEGN